MPRLSAYQVLFPLAALWALTAVGLKVAGEGGWLTEPEHWPVGWHGHELIFGYAFAVVGGYLLTRLGPIMTLLVCGAWMLGRLATFGPTMAPVVTGTMALAFPLVLFLGAGLPLARAAKKPRNQVFAPLLAGLGLAEMAYQLGVFGILPGGPVSGLLLGLDLLGVLLFVMGGRNIQSANATAASSSAKASKGVRYPRHFRGVVLCSQRTSSRSSALYCSSGTLRGRSRRSQPLVFSIAPRCQGA